MAVTRINNNQVTTAIAGNSAAGINAAVKVQDYSIISQKLANDIVIGNSLTVTGNIATANILTNGYYWANGVPIDFSSLNYSNANVAAFLPTYTGNLSGSNVSANTYYWANGAPVVFGNTVSGIVVGDQQFFGDGNTVQFAITTPATTTSAFVSINGVIQYPGVSYAISGANTIAFANAPATTDFIDIRFMGAGNINVSVSYSDSNVISLLQSGNLTSNIVTTGNIQGGYLLGNGALISGLPAGYSNANAKAYLSVFDGNIIPAANNVYSIGNLTNQWSSVYIAANTLYFDGWPLSAANANVLLYNSQPVVTESSDRDIATSGNIDADVITANLFVGSGAGLTGLYANSNASAYFASGTASANIITTANVSGSYVLGNGRFLTDVVGNYSDSNVATYLPTYTGNLNSLTGNVTTTANVRASSLLTSGLALTSNVISSPTNITIDPLSDSSSNGTVFILGNLQISGNLTAVNSNVVTIDSLLFEAANNASNPAAASGGGLAVGPLGTPYASWTFNSVTNTWDSNLGIVSAGNVNATYFNGNGRFLTGVYGNADVSNYLASGTDTANIITTGNVNATYFNGNGRFLTDVIGNYSNANVQSYLPTYTGAIAALAGNVTTTANIQGAYVLGNGAFLTGLPTQYANSDVSNYLASGTDTANIITTANVNGAFFNGNGRFLTGLAATYGNTEVSNYLDSGTDTANIITSANIQGSNIIASSNVSAVNFTASGTLIATGNVRGANFNTTGQVVAGGNITGNYFIGNGSQLTGIVSNYGNSNVSNYLASGTDTANIITSANISADYFLGNGRFLTGLDSQYSNTNAQSYLTGYVQDIIPAANLTYSLGNTANVWNTVNANVVNATNVVSTSAQVGVINISSNLISSLGNITIDPLNDGTRAGNVTILGNLTVAGTTTTVEANTAVIDNLVWISANSASNPTLASGGGIQVGPGAGYATLLFNSVANAWVSNLTFNAPDINVTGNATAGNMIADNFTYANGVSIINNYGDANVEAYLPTYGGNLASLTGNVTTTANISGLYILGNGAFLTDIQGNYANANVADYLPIYTGNLVSLTGDVITTANIIGAQVGNAATYLYGDGSNITGLYGDANVEALLEGGTLANNIITTGNVYSGNIEVTGNITGAIIGNAATYLYGDGSNITNIPSANILANGTSNVVIPDADGNISFNVGNSFAGNISATSVSIGVDAGYTQGTQAVAIGAFAGSTQQGNGAVAIGADAGRGYYNPFPIPYTAGQTDNSIAIGSGALYNGGGGNSAIYIGQNAGYSAAIGSQYDNQIVLNASGSDFSPTGGAGFYVNPVTSDPTSTANALFFNTVTNEITYTTPFGNANVSNYLASGTDTANIITTGNIRGNYVLGNGFFLTSINYSNTNVRTYLSSGSNPSNIVTSASVIAYGNVLGGNIGNAATYLYGNGSNITGLYSNTNVQNYLAGFAQDIIPSANLTYSLGNTANVWNTVNAGNVISTTSQVGVLNFATNVISSFSNITIDPLNDGGPGGNVTILGNLFVTGTLTTVNANSSAIDNLVWVSANAATNASEASGGGLQVGPGAGYATWLFNSVSNSWVSNIAISATSSTVAGNATAGNMVADNFTYANGVSIINNYSNANVESYLPTYSGNLASLLGNVTTTANVDATYFNGNGRFLTGVYGNLEVSEYLPTYTGNLDSLLGNVTTTANISADYFLGNGRFLTGMYGNSDVSNYLDSGTDTANIITTGNIGGNFATFTGNLSAGNATAAGINATSYVLVGQDLGGGIFTTGAVSLPGVGSNVNVLLGNVNAGNVNASYLWGNGSNITNLTPGNNIVNGTSNVRIATANGNITFAVGSQPAGNISTTSVALGTGAGINQGTQAVAIGNSAGRVSQGTNTVAIGYQAGNSSQSALSVAVGYQAGQASQGTSAIAIGRNAGNSSQGGSSIAIGYTAGGNAQGTYSTAVGYQAGQSGQGNYGVAIGYQAGNTSQSQAGIAIGWLAGSNVQGASAIAIGYQAGNLNQTTNGIAIGTQAGANVQGLYGIAIGFNAGNNTQANQTVAIGLQAGQTTQGQSAVAVGVSAGQTTQGVNSVAIGSSAGATSQGTQAVAVGLQAGSSSQGQNSVAIGMRAGQSNQANSTIIINATGTGVNGVAGQTNSFYVDPIRKDNGNTVTQLNYNATTKEITYGNAPPTFQAVSTLNSTVTLTSGAATLLQLGTEDWDTNGCFNNTASTVTLNGISAPAYSFAPNRAGYYQVNGYFSFASMPSNTGIVLITIYKNGSAYKRGVRLACNTNGVGVQVSQLVYLNGTSDYIQLYGSQGTGSSADLETNGADFSPTFSAAWVRGA